MACSSLDEPSSSWMDLIYSIDRGEKTTIKHTNLSILKLVIPNLKIDEIRVYIWYEPNDNLAEALGIGHKKIMLYTSMGAYMTDRVSNCVRITFFPHANIEKTEKTLTAGGYIFVKSVATKKSLHDFVNKLQKRNSKLVREPYNLLTNNCLHYEKEITKSLGK